MATVKATLAAWRDAKVKRLMKALDKANGVLANRVEANAPVDEGDLKRSVHALPARLEADQIKGEVVVNARHGHLVEYGTVDQAAHPFFRPAVRSEEPRMIRIVRDETR